MTLCSMQFSTVLPHEPIPERSPSSGSDDGGDDDERDSCRGYVHLQGSFVPRRKEGGAGAGDAARDDGDAEDESTQLPKRCRCEDAGHVEATLRTNLRRVLSNWGMAASDVLSVRALRETNSNDNGNANANRNIAKVRITLSSPARARTITARLRRGSHSPRDLLLSSAADDFVLGNNNETEGFCPHGCGGRYAGRPLQVTQIAPMPNQEESSEGERDAAAEERRWARAAPPKFRRLQLSTDPVAASRKDALTEGELQSRRGETRFVRVENVLTGLTPENVRFRNRNEEGEEVEEVDAERKARKADLLSIFAGKPTGGGTDETSQLYRGMVEDDVRHAFQEALRESLRLDVTRPSDRASPRTDDDDESDGCRGVELFMKSDTSPGKKGKAGKGKKHAVGGGGDPGGASTLYDHLHLGMRSNADATKLIRSWQGRRITMSMELPESFVGRATATMPPTTATQSTTSKLPTKITVTTGKLYLDYADVVLPKGRRSGGVLRGKNPSDAPSERTRGEKSRSECTSVTRGVRVPGLRLLPDYVSEGEEGTLLAALAGPHAPWAPPQRTPGGGIIRRRVQHYGYVFDYESADVLRREGDGGGGDEGGDRSACPPLPSMGQGRRPASETTDEDVERRIEEAVEDARGWEALAGVVERTRRFDFAPAPNDIDAGGDTTPSSSPERSSGKQTYPHINQLTLNEYTPGQGIGSHVDTLTAFEDGLLVITLGGGVVMEFRRVAAAADGNGKKLLYLPPRSMLLLSGDARYEWEHMIVSRTTDTVDGKVLPRKLRVSLTLRTALAPPTGGRARAPPLPRYESCAFPPRWGQPSDDASATGAKLERDHSNPHGGHRDRSDERSDLVTPATESRHVHAVYDAIATQWHHTRGRRGVLWPGASRFLEELPGGSVVADVGCGDGKYFPAIWASGSYVIGTDISEPLLRTAATKATGGCGGEENGATDDGPQHRRLADEKRALGVRPAVAVADCIHLPFVSGSCDAAICIAVMHHLSTEGRRLRCLSELRRVVRAGGLILVQAWALEQEEDSKRKFHGTDVLVPFNAQPRYLRMAEENGGEARGGSAPRPAANEASGGKGVAQMMAERYDGAEFDGKKNLVVFQRYCHMYRRGELEGLCERLPGLELVESSYEKGNHVVLLRVSR